MNFRSPCTEFKYILYTCTYVYTNKRWLRHNFFLYTVKTPMLSYCPTIFLVSYPTIPFCKFVPYFKIWKICFIRIANHVFFLYVRIWKKNGFNPGSKLWVYLKLSLFLTMYNTFVIQAQSRSNLNCLSVVCIVDFDEMECRIWSWKNCTYFISQPRPNYPRLQNIA